MEPNFTLPATTPRSSKTELIIGGLKVYVYGLEEVQQGCTDVAVLYHAHRRTRTYRDSETFAHELLHRYRSDGRPKKAGLIAVAVDARNHGDRKLSDITNMDWSQGNELHAQDMLSGISGGAQDSELLMDYLPTYLPQFDNFYNIGFGISLGGHVSWRLGTSSIATRARLHGLVIIIGCPNLSALLLGRLGVDLEALNVPIDEVYTIPYDKLSELLTESQRKRWPRALSQHIAEMDEVTAKWFPQNIPTCIMNGKLDPLVPDRFTEAWVKKQHALGYENIDYFVQENTGHTCTKEMVDNASQWLIQLFAA